ncbi:SDR family oxidoreductase [Leucobacter luti]|uniref:SDR family oxidoreductase n=1 Tax=Leucobacter luti TaxID=340320 RepID=UPI003D01C1D0
MKVAVAGGTGVVGSLTVRIARERGHEAVALSRRTGVDLVTGSGLDLTGVDAVIDASGGTTVSAKASREFFRAVTEHLFAAEKRAGVRHHVALSIVGAAAHPHGYYAGKALQEELVAAGPVPGTILRATQFFEFALQNAVRIGSIALLPRMRSQPVAAASVAGELVSLAEAGPGAAPGVTELAGPRAVRMAELLREIRDFRGESGRVIEFPLPGRFGRTLASGGLLPGPAARRDPVTLAAWLLRA